MLFKKSPPPKDGYEIYNDINGAVVNLFEVLRDPASMMELQRRLQLTPYSRKVWRQALNEFRYCGDPGDPIDRAHRFFVLVRMSFSGAAGSLYHASFSSTKTASNGVAINVARYLSAISHLPEISQRLLQTQIECQSFEVIIPKFDGLDTLFYLDPPYMHNTRKAGSTKAYGPYEMTESQHTLLIDMIQNVKGMVVLSGYDNPLYDLLCNKANWERIGFEWKNVTNHPKSKTEKDRTESLWISPKCLESLQSQGTSFHKRTCIFDY